MSTKTTDATNAEVGTKTQSNPPVKKAGGISRRHSLIPIALRGDNDDNYNYLASPAGKPGSADFTGKEGDGGAGTSHMNMKIIRNEEYNDNMTEEDESGKVDWYVNRYKLIDSDALEPVSFSASMTFDYEQERLRQDQLETNKELESQAANSSDPDPILAQVVPYYSLPESWSGPHFGLGFNWGGYYLNTRVSYNIYKRASTSTSLSLSLPPFWSSRVNFNYVFEKSPELQADTGDLLFRRTKTSTMSLSTGLIPLVSTGITLVGKQTEGSEDQYGTSLNISYIDRSGCWGLRFVREKDLNQLEENANYIIQLSVIFLGNSRASDISPSLERELPRFTFTN